MHLICSFSFFGASYAFYKIHKLWKRDVTENDKLYNFQIKATSFKHWLLLGMLVIMGIVYFFKALP
ncbi:hypothetical protein [Flavobacterium sp. KACC 22763]|uniref:hypothetical protein n=1 Tax=Flavobacterium sp. KACC 22763 TaxID=3025668 RepID=UPI0023651B15|nr:hypothetical protein [Flavobacterium sp. KACC 22763]WDF64705.1 hypothetical protein PQ463_00850 [Flavobacterium sp. KACC 22763]